MIGKFKNRKLNNAYFIISSILREEMFISLIYIRIFDIKDNRYLVKKPLFNLTLYLYSNIIM